MRPGPTGLGVFHEAIRQPRFYTTPTTDVETQAIERHPARQFRAAGCLEGVEGPGRRRRDNEENVSGAACRLVEVHQHHLG